MQPFTFKLNECYLYFCRSQWQRCLRAAIKGSTTTWGCLFLFPVCVVMCSRSFEAGRSPFQVLLPNIYKYSTETRKMRSHWPHWSVVPYRKRNRALKHNVFESISPLRQDLKDNFWIYTCIYVISWMLPYRVSEACPHNARTAISGPSDQVWRKFCLCALLPSDSTQISRPLKQSNVAQILF